MRKILLFLFREGFSFRVPPKSLVSFSIKAFPLFGGYRQVELSPPTWCFSFNEPVIKRSFPSDGQRRRPFHLPFSFFVVPAMRGLFPFLFSSSTLLFFPLLAEFH